MILAGPWQNGYAGAQAGFGQLSADLGYARCIYDSSGTVSGELHAEGSLAVTGSFSVGADAELSGLAFATSFPSLKAN